MPAQYNSGNGSDGAVALDGSLRERQEAEPPETSRKETRPHCVPHCRVKTQSASREAKALFVQEYGIFKSIILYTEFTQNNKILICTV